MTAIVLNAFSGNSDYMHANAWQVAICLNVPDPAPDEIVITAPWHTSNGAGFVNGVPHLYAEAGVQQLGPAQGDPLPFGDWVGRIDGALTLVAPESVDESVTGLARAVYRLPSSLIAPYAGLGVPPASTSHTAPSSPTMSGLVLRTNIHKPASSFGPLTDADWYRPVTAGSNTGSLGFTIGNTTGPITADGVFAPPPPPVPPELVPAIVRHEITLRHSAFLAGE
jgi:hypothetical protein